MKSIIEDIKNQEYKKVYLLYGSEAYLKQQYKVVASVFVVLVIPTTP